MNTNATHTLLLLLLLLQVCSLEGQLGITRDELAQKDAHLELLR